MTRTCQNNLSITWKIEKPISGIKMKESKNLLKKSLGLDDKFGISLNSINNGLSNIKYLFSFREKLNARVNNMETWKNCLRYARNIEYIKRLKGEIWNLIAIYRRVMHKCIVEVVLLAKRIKEVEKKRHFD